MAELKAKLRSDLTAAMKAQDKARMAALRMALSAITTEEVAGKAARELTEDEVRRVLTREVKKRKEAADAFAGAGREERAAAERAEGEILTEYLPAQLDDDELGTLATEAVEEIAMQLGATPGPKHMGQVMRVANAKVAGRAEDARVAAAVKARLAG